MKNRLKEIKYSAETAALHLLCLLLPYFSDRSLRFFGKVLGLAAYYLLPIRKKTGLFNLDIMKPGSSADYKERQIRKAYINLALSFFEFFQIGLKGRREFKSIPGRGFKHLDSLLKDRKGVIVISAHLGNWEYIGAEIASRGIPMNYLVRIQNNVAAGELFDEFRRRAGIGIITKNYSIRQIFSLLKRNEWIGFLCDQDGRQSGTPVRFFNKECSWFKGPAFFSLKLGLPILPVFCRRDRKNLPYLYFHPPVYPDKAFSEENGSALCQKIASLFEKEIERDPGRWVLFHKRFHRE